MDISEKAKELGEKYNIDTIDAQDLLAYVDIRLFFEHPIRSMFESDDKRCEKVYALTERYLSRVKYKMSKGLVHEMVPSYEF